MSQTTGSAGPDMTRVAVAEFFGTMVLMLVGPGSAILAANRIGVSGVALAFGFAAWQLARTTSGRPRLAMEAGTAMLALLTLTMLVRHAMTLDLTPEEMKAWSQNLGHVDVLTTFTSYGAVPAHRQGELIRESGRDQAASDPLDDPDVRALIAAIQAKAA